MAEVNGISKHGDTVAVLHLGKRKRTVSPEVEKSKESKQQPVLQNVLQLLRKHDTTPSLLKYPLPLSESNRPDLKRARLVKSESSSDTIENRILTGSYDSLHALKDDVRTVRDAILMEASAAPPRNWAAESDVEEQLSKILNAMEQYDPEAPEVSKPDSDTTAKADPIKQKPKQFLSLRSTVNGSAHVLFSGLQIQQRSEMPRPHAIPEAAGSGLPNGFELTDFSALGGKEDSKKQEKRTFDKVFTSLRRLKPLDLPHTAKDVVRGNTLDFIPSSSRADNLPLNKHDYKFAKLPTGSWLSYRQSQQGRKPVQQSSSNTDFKAALAANNLRQGGDLTEEELFSSVYSSFAPSSDSAYSLISEEDRSRQWWSQNGEQKLSKLFRSVEQEQAPVDEQAGGSDEFADVVANFEPQVSEEANADRTENDVDSLLEEVSEMIETLSSYQKNRSLDHLVSGKLGKPEKPEFDTFEMLRSQLSILIASLPPFAVAKLNGDQLNDLNISTTLVVEVPDYPGTGQPDDYILRRQKMAQQATQAAARPTATPQPVRPNYSSVQANTMNYNSAVRNYNSSVPATAAYGMRTTQSYQTPSVTRPTYSQTPTFQASTAGQGYSANRPTIQQFQRPAISNGYSSYGSNAPLQPSAQSSQPLSPGTYAQRPSQPGYQQRAQESAAVLARSTSPQKPQPLLNGTGQHYTPRQYQAQTQQTQGQSQQYAYQRQGSGTPTTPIAPATSATRYDGAGDRSTSAQSSGNAQTAQIPATAQQPQGSTVEVSR